MEIAENKLLRLLARNKSVDCADNAAGDSLLLYVAQSRKVSPRWVGPAKILGIDETGVAVSLQSRLFKVGRYCVRKRFVETDVTDEKWKSSLRRGSK